MTKLKIKNKAKGLWSMVYGQWFKRFRTIDYRLLTIDQLVFVLSFCLCFGICHYSFAQDKIIAIVNNDCITQKDLNDFINFMRIQLSQEYQEDKLEEKIQSIKPDLLNKLIEDRLILQQAKKENIKIDEAKVKARVNEIKSHYISDVEFQNALAGQGLVQADIETRIKEQLFMYNIVDQKVRGKIVVRPEEVTSFYNENLKDFAIGEERELGLVTLENEDAAKAISLKIKGGERLEDIAAKYSLSLENKLKTRKQGELRKDIEGIVFSLNIGETSEPIKVNDKYFIFKLVNIIPPRQLSLSEVQDRIQLFLFEKKMQEELKKWLRGLKDNAYIKIMQDE